MSSPGDTPRRAECQSCGEALDCVLCGERQYVREVVPSGQPAYTDEDVERLGQLIEWIERDRRESDKVLSYTLEARAVLESVSRPEG